MENQRGAVLATELKNNANKLAKWTAAALISGADMIKLGYVSRVHMKDNFHHAVLGTQVCSSASYCSSPWFLLDGCCSLTPLPSCKRSLAGAISSVVGKAEAQRPVQGCSLRHAPSFTKGCRAEVWYVAWVQVMKPKDFAQQINLNMDNCWGIVRALVDLCMKQEDGKYLLVKDPNKQLLRLYSVPEDAFQVSSTRASQSKPRK
jgi:hypothetical protein